MLDVSVEVAITEFRKISTQSAIKQDKVYNGPRDKLFIGS